MHKNPDFDQPNESDYAKTLQALIVCMNKFGPGAAIEIVSAFKRRQATSS